MPIAAHTPDRNLALELVRVTEAAALQAARWVGRGDKIAADQAAVDGMHAVLGTDPDGRHRRHRRGREGRGARCSHNGERVGDGTPPEVDIAVDPLEGTRLCALGMPNALAVIALSERGTMFDPGPCVYMEKMAGREEIADLLDLDRAAGRDRRADRRAPRGRRRRRHRRRARPPAPRGGHRRHPRGRRPRAADHRRRRRPARCWPSPSARRWTCCGGSAARRRA